MLVFLFEIVCVIFDGLILNIDMFVNILLVLIKNVIIILIIVILCFNVEFFFLKYIGGVVKGII